MAAYWEHLQPLVEALIRGGNVSSSNGFRPTQGGMECDFELPLDRDVVKQFIADDERIRYDEAADTAHCSHCWAAILGGDAIARSRRHHASWSAWDPATEAWSDRAVWDVDGWRYEP